MFDTSRVIYGTVGLLPSVTKKKEKKKRVSQKYC